MRAEEVSKIFSGTPSAYLLEEKHELRVFSFGPCLVCVYKESFAGEPLRLHLMISTEGRRPTYEEVAKARYRFLPDRLCFGLVYPSERRFRSHANTIHLFEIVDPTVASSRTDALDTLRQEIERLDTLIRQHDALPGMKTMNEQYHRIETRNFLKRLLDGFEAP